MTPSSNGRLSYDGVFPNGTTAIAVAQFVLDYDGTAAIQDVADYFHLHVDDVAAALQHYERNLQQIRPAGEAGER